MFWLYFNLSFRFRAHLSPTELRAHVKNATFCLATVTPQSQSGLSLWLFFSTIRPFFFTWRSDLNSSTFQQNNEITNFPIDTFKSNWALLDFFFSSSHCHVCITIKPLIGGGKNPTKMDFYTSTNLFAMSTKIYSIHTQTCYTVYKLHTNR